MKAQKIICGILKVLIVFNLTLQPVSSLQDPQQFATTIKFIPRSQRGKIEISQSAVILCFDAEDLLKFNSLVVLKNSHPKKLKFLTYVEKSINGKYPTASPLTITYGKFIHFQYFLENLRNSVALSTFEWFREKNCNQPQITTLNTMSKESLQWQSELKIEEKFQNFHNCPLRFYIEIHNGLSACIVNYKLQSFLVDVFKILAGKGNFSMNFTYTGVYDRNYENKGEVLHLYCPYTIDNQIHTHITATFSDATYGFVVPPGEPYTSYEKMLMPFDRITWILLILTFCLAFGTIFVLRFMPKRIQESIYGEGVTMPAFNVLGTFFGIGQVRLPSGNFPRFILMLFILFCLVIRTAYQGVFFDMMTSDMRKKTPESIKELFEKNYTIYTITEFREVLVSMVDKSRRPTVIAEEKLYDEYIWNKDFLNSSQKTAMLTDQDIFSALTGNSKFMKETLYTVPEGLCTHKNHFIFQLLDATVQPLISTGVIQNLLKHTIEMCKTIPEEIDAGPKVLTMNDLSFGFNIWLIVCSVTLQVFLMEVSWRASVRGTIALIGHVVVLLNLRRIISYRIFP